MPVFFKMTLCAINFPFIRELCLKPVIFNKRNNSVYCANIFVNVENVRFVKQNHQFLAVEVDLVKDV